MDPIEQKIADKTVTVEDFNQLIAEALGSSAIDRVRRRVRKTPTDSHIDAHGHQQLSGPKFAARVAPKRQPDNSKAQMRHRGKAAHKRSARTQTNEALDTLLTMYGKPISETAVQAIPNKAALQRLVAALLTRGDLDQAWLAQLKQAIS